MRKRGQLTIFIIIGILLLFTFGIIFYLTSYRNLSEGEINPLDKAPFQNYMDSCLAQITENSLLAMGRQGMYDVAPNDSVLISSVEVWLNNSAQQTRYFLDVVPVYVSNNHSYMPTLNQMERELESRTAYGFAFCADALAANYEGLGYVISIGEPMSNAVLGRDTKIIITMPITISHSETSTSISKFAYTSKLNILSKYKAVNKIVQEQLHFGEYMPLGFLNQMAVESNFTYITELVDLEIVRYELSFNDEKNPFIYMFAVRYNWTNEESKKLVLKHFVSLNATAGKEFSYTVLGSAEGLMFEDDSELFDIGQRTGFINFTPQASDAGLYQILVTVTDMQGFSDYQVILLGVRADG